MARKDDYRAVQRFCVMCTNVIPAERPWNAVTCSKECSKRRVDYRRSREDALQCRYCNRPSTPEERQRYQLWRRWEKAGQSDEQSTAKLLAENVRLKRKLSEMEAAHEHSNSTEAGVISDAAPDAIAAGR